MNRHIRVIHHYLLELSFVIFRFHSVLAKLNKDCYIEREQYKDCDQEIGTHKAY